MKAIALYLALSTTASLVPHTKPAALPMPTCSPDDAPCVKQWTCTNLGRCK